MPPPQISKEKSLAPTLSYKLSTLFYVQYSWWIWWKQSKFFPLDFSNIDLRKIVREKFIWGQKSSGKNKMEEILKENCRKCYLYLGILFRENCHWKRWHQARPRPSISFGVKCIYVSQLCIKLIADTILSAANHVVITRYVSIPYQVKLGINCQVSSSPFYNPPKRPRKGERAWRANQSCFLAVKLLQRQFRMSDVDME